MSSPLASQYRRGRYTDDEAAKQLRDFARALKAINRRAELRDQEIEELADSMIRHAEWLQK